MRARRPTARLTLAALVSLASCATSQSSSTAAETARSTSASASARIVVASAAPSAPPTTGDSASVAASSSAPAASSRFTVRTTRGIVEVVDSQTGLTWKQLSEPGPHDWLAARDACAGLGKGYRLPTPAELLTLVDGPPPDVFGARSLKRGTLVTTVFPTMVLHCYWSSVAAPMRDSHDEQRAHDVCFNDDGAVVEDAPQRLKGECRCVR